MALKDCSKCMVYTNKGKRLSEARVVHTKDGIRLYFDNYKIRDVRMKSRIDFYDSRLGLLITMSESVIHRNPDFPEMAEPWMAECRILVVKEIVQRQRDVRAKMNLEVSFKSDERLVFHGTIENLSAGGMFITTSQPLQKEQIVSFKYAFRTLAREFNAATLWSRRMDGGLYGYGLKFIHLSGGAESAIRSYVYRQLLKGRQNEE